MSKKSKIDWLSDTAMTTPTGTARYSYLREADTKFEPCFRITLELDNNVETEDFIADLVSRQNAFLQSKGEDPMSKLKCLKTDMETGTKSLQFKASANLASGQPRPLLKIFDSNNVLTEDEPWGGDRIRMSFKPGGWESGFGIGVKLYMMACQIVEKNGGSSTGGSPFDVVEGGYISANEPTPSAVSAAIAEEDVPTLDDSDIPF
jgi:hypothetical protein